MTDCQCDVAGWCDRHQVRKSAHWIRLCRTNKSYRVAWDQGRGPGQRHVVAGQPAATGPPPGPGTLLGRMLGCGGFRQAKELNEWGPDACLERIDMIVGWLIAARNLSDSAARRMILLAVERARGD